MPVWQAKSQQIENDVQRGESDAMQKNNSQAVLNARGFPVIQDASTQSVPVSDVCKHLNFKVPPDFHREFKTFAASHDISMTALLIEAFSVLREAQP